MKFLKFLFSLKVTQMKAAPVNCEYFIISIVYLFIFEVKNKHKPVEMFGGSQAAVISHHLQRAPQNWFL